MHDTKRYKRITAESYIYVSNEITKGVYSFVILSNRSNKPNLENMSNIGNDISAQVCGKWRTENRLDAHENWV